MATITGSMTLFANATGTLALTGVAGTDSFEMAISSGVAITGATITGSGSITPTAFPYGTNQTFTYTTASTSAETVTIYFTGTRGGKGGGATDGTVTITLTGGSSPVAPSAPTITRSPASGNISSSGGTLALTGASSTGDSPITYTWTSDNTDVATVASSTNGSATATFSANSNASTASVSIACVASNGTSPNGSSAISVTQDAGDTGTGGDGGDSAITVVSNTTTFTAGSSDKTMTISSAQTATITWSPYGSTGNTEYVYSTVGSTGGSTATTGLYHATDDRVSVFTPSSAGTAVLRYQRNQWTEQGGIVGNIWKGRVTITVVAANPSAVITGEEASYTGNSLTLDSDGSTVSSGATNLTYQWGISPSIAGVTLTNSTLVFPTTTSANTYAVTLVASDSTGSTSPTANHTVIYTNSFSGTVPSYGGYGMEIYSASGGVIQRFDEQFIRAEKVITSTNNRQTITTTSGSITVTRPTDSTKVVVEPILTTTSGYSSVIYHGAPTISVTNNATTSTVAWSNNDPNKYGLFNFFYL